MLLNPFDFGVITLAGGIQTPWYDVEPGLYRIQIVLPIRPIWPGFAINTIFYTAILWLLFAAPGFIRRRIRIKRGRCGACGYDLRGQPASGDRTCPECGANA